GAAMELAKQKIIDMKIMRSYAPIVSYALKPTEMFLVPSATNVLFFTRIFSDSKIGGAGNAICLVDPTRNIVSKRRGRDYYISECPMHHFSHIRRDLGAKYDNSSSPDMRANKKQYMANTRKATVAIVPDKLGLEKYLKNNKKPKGKT
ncbi:MAG: hypothetical protein FWG39_04180, partial [Alphaproteobacteria bacterium]|nr:hypothetical protein [Alphaproteobacteria bacterium]